MVYQGCSSSERGFAEVWVDGLEGCSLDGSSVGIGSKGALGGIRGGAPKLGAKVDARVGIRLGLPKSIWLLAGVLVGSKQALYWFSTESIQAEDSAVWLPGSHCGSACLSRSRAN